ncbi:YfhO family protein, partial [Mycobacterium kansasii]
AQGYTHLTDTLMGVKYRLNINKEPAVTRLDSYAGIGFAVPNQLAQLQLKDQAALTNQQQILTALGAKPDTLAPVSVLKVNTRAAKA